MSARCWRDVRMSAPRVTRLSILRLGPVHECTVDKICIV